MCVFFCHSERIINSNMWTENKPITVADPGGCLAETRMPERSTKSMLCKLFFEKSTKLKTICSAHIRSAPWIRYCFKNITSDSKKLVCYNCYIVNCSCCTLYPGKCGISEVETINIYFPTKKNNVYSDHSKHFF